VYTPAAFAETDPGKIHDFIRRYGFATVVNGGPAGLLASHLPLLLDADAGPQGTLIGHMARANPQWRSIEGEVLAVFQGPHAYVSAGWYEEEGTVPTWNYVAVHAYGTLRPVEDPEGLIDLLRKSVHLYEDSSPRPWAFDPAAPHVGNLLKAIVGFRIEINRLEGKWKLSQNHPGGRREKVIEALERGPDENSRQIAALMTERRP